VRGSCVLPSESLEVEGSGFGILSTEVSEAVHARENETDATELAIVGNPSSGQEGLKAVAAYLLALLGGNASSSAKDIESIIGSVGAEADADRISPLFKELEGKDILEVIAAGKEKFASVPSGGGGGVVVSSGGGAAAPVAAEEKKKKEFLARADAAGNTADLNSAYKAPEEVKSVEVKRSEVSGSSGSEVKDAAVAQDKSLPKEADDVNPLPTTETEGATSAGEVGTVGINEESEVLTKASGARVTAGHHRDQEFPGRKEGEQGLGFTLAELKAAGISKKLAPTIGIAVDHRCKKTETSGEAKEGERSLGNRVEELTVHLQNAGPEVVEAKAGAGSIMLSVAYTATKFGESCMRTLNFNSDVYKRL
jgi:large subunit ribosomal protein LP2